jgi:protein-S-isoprenylcysteine O-methyltransferase Ste14
VTAPPESERPAVTHSAGVRVAPAAYYLAGLIAGFAHDLFPGIVPCLPLSLRPIGALALVCGLTIGSLGLLALHRAGTTIDPMRSTTALVTGSIYRVTRNPAYLGLTLVYAGVAVLGASTASLLLLPVVVLLISTLVIQREERYLSALFGSAYEEYRRRVRRWL